MAVDVVAVFEFDNSEVEIPGGWSALTRTDDMVSVEAATASLVPGDAVTLWWAVFNNPEFCAGSCGPTDLSHPEVEAAVLYADGTVVGPDGKAAFSASLDEGDVYKVDAAHQGLPGAGIGLADASKATVHIVMRTHGAAFPEGDPRRTEQLTTFNGGCHTECTNVQAALFDSPDSLVVSNPVHLFADLTVDVEGAGAKLTRYADTIAVRADTAELVPGDAVTLWWAVFNNPEFCAGACDPTDLSHPDVEAAVLYADGAVVGEDGKATFSASLDEGDVSKVDAAQQGLPGAGIGLADASKATIHIVMRTHGAAFPEGDPRRTEQLTTFNGGCNTECTNVQAALFESPNRKIGDFNRDSVVAAQDIDLLFLTIGNNNENPLFDVNQDGAVDAADVDELILNVIGTRRGDANLDGKVEFEDFLALSSNFGRQGGWSDGDNDGNGMVDFADFLSLSANFGFDRA